MLYNTKKKIYRATKQNIPLENKKLQLFSNITKHKVQQQQQTKKKQSSHQIWFVSFQYKDKYGKKKIKKKCKMKMTCV